MKAPRTRRRRRRHPDAAPDEVWFDYPEPPYSAEYERVFGTSPRFDQSHPALLFPRTWLDSEQFHADPRLFEVLREHADRALRQLDAKYTTAERVRSILRRGTVTLRF